MNKMKCKPDEVEHKGVCVSKEKFKQYIKRERVTGSITHVNLKKMDIPLARRIIYTASPKDKDIVPLIKAARFVFDKWADLKIDELDSRLGRKQRSYQTDREDKEKVRKQIQKKYVEYPLIP